MSLRDLAKQALGQKGRKVVRKLRQRTQRAPLAFYPQINESKLREILTDKLNLSEGDTVFVHSSIDKLNLDFPFYRVLPIMQDVVGTRGTLLFPTYPQLSSYEFLKRAEVFDVRRTPSYTGILSEVARRQGDAFRSLHPTKSVCAIGPNARDLTKDHHRSPYPYDVCSPYHRIIEAGGKIVGIGVSTANLSFVHCVDDALGDDFPVRPYHSELFAAKCIDSSGEVAIVETYAHDLRKMNHNIPRFMRTHVQDDACLDLTIEGVRFFKADARRLFDEMVQLAREGKTIYPRSAYKNQLADGIA